MKERHDTEECKKRGRYCPEHDCCKICHLFDELYHETLYIRPDSKGRKKHPLFNRIANLYWKQIELCTKKNKSIKE